MSAPECVWDARAILGEGPVWHEDEGALYWVDIKAPAIHRFIPATGEKASWPMRTMIGCLAPASGGGFLAALRNGFARLSLGPPGQFPTVTPIADPERDRPGNRFNDGKLAPDGSFWAGTMDDSEREASGAWWRLGPDGGVTKLDEGYRVTNGPAFDAVRGRVYLTDSARQTVFAAELMDGGAGFSGKRVFAQFGAGDGYPDGMTVDAEGGLWIAFWDGACLRRLNPAGEIIQTVPMPVRRPTSLAFAGDTIYVTSASADLKAKLGSGGLYRLNRLCLR